VTLGHTSKCNSGLRCRPFADGLGRIAVLLVDGGYGVLLAWKLHLPPNAVPLVSDIRFCRSAQRLARLT
jgi:hypothetical protein